MSYYFVQKQMHLIVLTVLFISLTIFLVMESYPPQKGTHKEIGFVLNFQLIGYIRVQIIVMNQFTSGQKFINQD